VFARPLVFNHGYNSYKHFYLFIYFWGFFVGATGEAHFDILYPGDATLFPRALLHFEINLGTKTASFVSALNSENPGTLVCTKSLSTSPTQ
jgi:hypothetical protein